MAVPKFSKELTGSQYVVARVKKVAEVDNGRGEMRKVSRKIITACGGLEFVQGEYRRVPAGMEAEAENSPYLDTKIEGAPAKKKAPAKE